MQCRAVTPDIEIFASLIALTSSSSFSPSAPRGESAAVTDGEEEEECLASAVMLDLAERAVSGIGFDGYAFRSKSDCSPDSAVDEGKSDNGDHCGSVSEFDEIWVCSSCGLHNALHLEACSRCDGEEREQKRHTFPSIQEHGQHGKRMQRNLSHIETILRCIAENKGSQNRDADHWKTIVSCLRDSLPRQWC